MSMRPPSRDAFYAAVAAPPAPGVVVRHRELAVPVTTPARLHHVVHGSTGGRGQSTAVSGTVLVPRSPWSGPGARPILSYGVGLHGLGRDCAPSRLIAAGEEDEWPLIRLALSLGWAVAVTDGDGLGMPGPHTYGAGRPGGHAMLDVVRAGVHLGLGLSPRAPVLLWGYSEGGRNAAFAAELHRGYAPELGLVGAALGGVPADLYAVVKAIDGGPVCGLGLGVLVGLAHAYDDPRLWSILSPTGMEAARRAATLDGPGLIIGFGTPLTTHTVRAQPWDDEAWRAVLAGERAGRMRPGVPTYHYHVARDEIVPVPVGHALRADYAAFGGDTTWVVLPSPNHLTGAVAGAGGALRWLTERLESHWSAEPSPDDRHQTEVARRPPRSTMDPGARAG